jgi:hypothetical protein
MVDASNELLLAFKRSSPFLFPLPNVKVIVNTTLPVGKMTKNSMQYTAQYDSRLLYIFLNKKMIVSRIIDVHLIYSTVTCEILSII